MRGQGGSISTGNQALWPFCRARSCHGAPPTAELHGRTSQRRQAKSRTAWKKGSFWREPHVEEQSHLLRSNIWACGTCYIKTTTSSSLLQHASMFEARNSSWGQVSGGKEIRLMTSQTIQTSPLYAIPNDLLSVLEGRLLAVFQPISGRCSSCLNTRLVTGWEMQ